MLKESREIKKMLTFNIQIEDWDQILKNVFQCYFKSTQFLLKLTKQTIYTTLGVCYLITLHNRPDFSSAQISTVLHYLWLS